MILIDLILAATDHSEQDACYRWLLVARLRRVSLEDA